VDAAEFIIAFQDHLAPKLDTYEQAVYLYIYRHSRLVGQDDTVIGFKSARRRLALGIGKMGSAPSENIIYSKLRSLEKKGCIKILSSERSGQRLKLYLPNEIPNLIPAVVAEAPFDLEAVDFFDVPEHRQAILRREENKCFYCLRAIDEQSYVIEHVLSRPEGDNGYRNLVAACRQCNNRKGAEMAEDFLRTLYRETLLDKAEFEARIASLKKLRNGDLKPVLNAR
jgi:hypothetical protein